MILVNQHSINIFHPEFAFLRIREDYEPGTDIDEFEEYLQRTDEYKYLSQEVRVLSASHQVCSYQEGDYIPTRERYYHKYPSRIAVLFEEAGTFKMQVFQDNTVGKLYTNILTQ